MAKRKKYRIFCVTEDKKVTGFTNEAVPPDLCPNNPAHEIIADSKATLDEYQKDNLSATADPTVNDDISQGYAIGSRWIRPDTNQEWVCTNNALGAAVWVEGSPEAFGMSVQQVSSDEESSTTNTSPQQKLRLTTPVVSAGTYRVAWYYEWKQSSPANECCCRVQVDDTTTVQEVNTSPNDSACYYPSGGFGYVVLTEAAHTIDLDFWSSSAQHTAYIRRARLEIWRIS